VVHREKVPLGNFEARSRELASEFRCVMKVFDSQPYVDLVMRMQKRDPNLYAGVFVTSKKVEVFKAVEQLAVPEEGKMDVRQVQINRNKALDELTGHIKKQGMAIGPELQRRFRGRVSGPEAHPEGEPGWRAGVLVGEVGQR
jgi:hypothetical protein